MAVEQKLHTSYVFWILLWDDSEKQACRHRSYFLLRSSSHAEPEWGIFISIHHLQQHSLNLYLLPSIFYEICPRTLTIYGITTVYCSLNTNVFSICLCVFG